MKTVIIDATTTVARELGDGVRDAVIAVQSFGGIMKMDLLKKDEFGDYESATNVGYLAKLEDGGYVITERGERWLKSEKREERAVNPPEKTWLDEIEEH